MAIDVKTEQPIYRGAGPVGLRNVGSYQVAGTPFVTGGAISPTEEIKVSFPYVTKKIMVIQSSSVHTAKEQLLRVHFASTSSGDVIPGLHYIPFDTHEDSFTFDDVKCKEIYLSCPADAPAAADIAYFIYASLTGIPTSSMFALTGSGITE